MHAPKYLYMTKADILEYIQSLPDDIKVTASCLNLTPPDDCFTGSLAGGFPMRKITEYGDIDFKIKMQKESLYASLNHRCMQQMNI